MQQEDRTSGRPRDVSADAALKSAALGLVRARGYGKVSIAAIVAAAGVARQTLYNRWSSKAELVLDAVFEEVGRYAAAPIGDDGTGAAEQLEAFLIQVFAHLEEDGETLRAIIAAAQEDADFQRLFRERFVLPREAMVTDLLRRAQARGEIGPARDPEMLSAMIHGAFWYRMLNGFALDRGLARAIRDEVFRP
ncbi:TetR-like C-terminal domain-containing protein [Roseovarius nubinhibens]|uniref:TetR family transcriptional regulator n=1 Tax=Roseovarius nubinhibens TaxID=314263 RepID=A0A348WG99_9RHOB|nr:TetR family transcriptional regulator [Roseovarius nubinhibens]